MARARDLLCWLGVAALAGPACDERSRSPAVPTYAYGVPLAPDAPWPKFRRNAEQDGRSDVRSSGEAGRFWAFQTGKGIFSSPIVGGDGTVYVGSADRFFYAIAADGTLRWKVETGELVDSSGLLDDQGRVYFGSGDGKLRALDARTGAELWSFSADEPAVTGGFINWFEGNVAIGPSGDLFVPNDNRFVYAIDRDTGAVRWKLELPDQTWSLPAVDAATGDLYLGNNNLLPVLGRNTFSVSASGEQRWANSSLGSVAASPLLLADKVVMAGFDGFVRAYDRATGRELWSFGTRDHVYASVSAAADGTLYAASTDGTLYALDPAAGTLRWAFDTPEPIRASPSVDGHGRIYFGAGDGRLYVLEPDGTLRFSLLLIDDVRNDLNASPALGRDAVYLAGESGQVFSVPYDHCLHAAEAGNPRCRRGGGEALPADGASLLFTTALGATLTTPPDAIEANQPLAFSLLVRDRGDTVLALLDSQDLEATLDPPAEVDVSVSGDRKFVTVVPRTRLAAGADGKVRLSLRAGYRVDLSREGLAFSGGRKGGTASVELALSLAPPRQGAFPLAVAPAPGEPTSVLELTRIAAPLPTILPSYNQIGFDAMHYLVGMVEGDPASGKLVAWGVGAMPGPDGAVADPATKVLFPLEVDYEGGLATLENRSGFFLEALGAKLAFRRFRVALRLDAAGKAERDAQLVVETRCGDINFYGQFLRELGLCNPDTDAFGAFGAARLAPKAALQAAPADLGPVTFAATRTTVTATLAGGRLRATEHALGVLLLDTATGKPVSLDYGLATTRTAAADGAAESVTLTFDRAKVPPRVRAYLMVDASPTARADLAIPE